MCIQHGDSQRKVKFYALVMVEKTNLTICHGVMGTTQAENVQQCYQVDAIDSSWDRASSYITGLSHGPHFLCLLKLWPGCKSQLMLNKKEQSKLDKWPKSKIPTINYTILLRSPTHHSFFPVHREYISNWIQALYINEWNVRLHNKQIKVPKIHCRQTFPLHFWLTQPHTTHPQMPWDDQRVQRFLAAKFLFF